MFSTSHEPCKILDEIKYRSTFHVISFFKEALVQTYKSDKITFLKSTSGSALEMICKEFGVNTVVAAVCPSDNEGNCNVGKSGAYITPIINKHEGIINRIAIIDSSLPCATGRTDETAIALSAFNSVCTDERAEEKAIEDISFGKELVG